MRDVEEKFLLILVGSYRVEVEYFLVINGDDCEQVEEPDFPNISLLPPRTNLSTSLFTTSMSSIPDQNKVQEPSE